MVPLATRAEMNWSALLKSYAGHHDPLVNGSDRGALLTVANLRGGIRLDPKDRGFQRFTYQSREAMLKGGINEAAWDELFKLLKSRKSLTRAHEGLINAHAPGVLQRLGEQFEALHPFDDDEPSFENSSWEPLAGLYDAASALHPTGAASFASTLCHFMFPKTYIPLSMGLTYRPKTSYGDDWKYCQRELQSCDCRDELVAELKSAATCSLGSDFPYHTKITELCIIGRWGAGKASGR